MALATAPTLVYEGLPDAALRELEQLHEQDGALRPERVIEVAADADSPLHSYFEWDDTEAARQHRIAQARQVIRSVKVYVSDRPAVQVRAYVSMGVEHGRAYQRTSQVVNNEFTLNELRRSLGRDLQRIQRKLQLIDEFAEAAAGLNGVIAMLS